MKTVFYLKQKLIIACSIAILIISCTKYTPPAQPAVDVNYNTTINGFAVTFTNKTSGGVSYKWDFGDGTTSTQENPIHTYPGKGKYVPTLYVTTKSGEVDQGSTVLNLSKTSPIKLDDNSLSDWDTISVNTYTSTVSTNVVKKAKFDYDATSVYFYIEMVRTQADDDIFDFYIDADNSSSTGYDVSGYFTGEGVDALIEGQILDPQGQTLTALYNYVGPGWNWSQASATEFYQIGTVKQENGVLKFEGKLSRSKISGLTGSGMKLGVVVTKNDWSAELGYLPDINTSAISIDMSE